MSVASNTGLCPLCGESNQCDMAAGVSAESPCWCTQVPFSAELLASVPLNAQGKLCICQRCASASASKAPVSSNPSIERTFQRPLRALWPAAHVER